MISLVFGLPGNGKSTYLRSILADTEKYIVVDGMGELPAKWHIAQFPEHAKKLDWSTPIQAIWTAPPNWAFWKTLKGYTIVIDEADMYWPNTSELQPSNGVHPCSDFIARHRHYGLNIICATQRPIQTPPLVRDLAGEIVCFQLSSEAGAYVKKYWGIEPPTEKYKWVRWRSE